MSDRSYMSKQNELVVKFFRRGTGLYLGVTDKGVSISASNYPFHYKFFFDKLNLDNRFRRRSFQPGQLKLGWKIADHNMKTHNGYQWRAGQWHVPQHSFESIFGGVTTSGECPQYQGDGLCLAKTWTGATSGNIYPSGDTKIMLIAYADEHVLHNSHVDKYRVRACYVIAVDTLRSFFGWLEGQGHTFESLDAIDRKLAFYFKKLKDAPVAFAA